MADACQVGVARARWTPPWRLPPMYSLAFTSTVPRGGPLGSHPGHTSPLLRSGPSGSLTRSGPAHFSTRRRSTSRYVNKPVLVSLTSRHLKLWYAYCKMFSEVRLAYDKLPSKRRKLGKSCAMYQITCSRGYLPFGRSSHEVSRGRYCSDDAVYSC